MIFLPRGTHPVAYFCVEYGIDNELPTYAGGLGILAGEVVSAAADANFPMIGIGLLHKGRRFEQQITEDGWQQDTDSTFDPNTSFLRETSKEGKPLLIQMRVGDEIVKIRSYYIRLADHTILFFLSPNVDGNSEEWRGLLNTIYWGDEDAQIRQNILLGVGGVKLLKLLGIKPSHYHLNEGRAGFVALERIKDIMKEDNCSQEEAWEKMRKDTVYTNHTLVKAGNASYDMGHIRSHVELLKEDSALDPDFVAGKGFEEDGGRFDMTRFALNAASVASAVSTPHLALSKKLWPEYTWKGITNGVHLPRWQTHAFRDPSLTDGQLWDNHMRKKHDLAKMVLDRTGFGYDPERLVITWARRIAAYKQPTVLFSDIEHLAKLVKNESYPVQILFAGKAHPGDEENKRRIQEIIGQMKSALSGNAIFVPNYDISLAKSLASGSDVWLNTPELGKEASGTSGMKASSNGVLNLTTAGGWASEVDWEKAGWELDAGNLAKSIYETLEKQIIPIYYEKDESGLSKEWIFMMKEAIKLSDKYSAERMLTEYMKYLYK